MCYFLVVLPCRTSTHLFLCVWHISAQPCVPVLASTIRSNRVMAFLSDALKSSDRRVAIDEFCDELKQVLIHSTFRPMPRQCLDTPWVFPISDLAFKRMEGEERDIWMASESNEYSNRLKKEIRVRQSFTLGSHSVDAILGVEEGERDDGLASQVSQNAAKIETLRRYFWIINMRFEYLHLRQDLLPSSAEEFGMLCECAAISHVRVGGDSPHAFTTSVDAICALTHRSLDMSHAVVDGASCSIGPSLARTAQAFSRFDKRRFNKGPRANLADLTSAGSTRPIVP